MNGNDFEALVAAVAEKMARLRRVDWVEEAIRLAGAWAPQQYVVRPRLVTLSVDLTTTTTTNTDTHDVGGSEIFVVRELRGHLTFDAWQSESATVGNMNPLPMDRAYIKASNCDILLEATDKSRKITYENDISLADILPAVGGGPIRFDDKAIGMVFGPGETISMRAALQSTNANVIGQASGYGVILTGDVIELIGKG